METYTQILNLVLGYENGLQTNTLKRSEKVEKHCEHWTSGLKTL